MYGVKSIAPVPAGFVSTEVMFTNFESIWTPNSVNIVITQGGLGHIDRMFKKVITDEPPHDKTNKMTVCPAKTQISLGICPVRSVFAARSMGS